MNSQIAAFIHDLTFTDLPEKVVHQARRCLLDLVGVAASGAQTVLSAKIYHHAARYHRTDGPQARLLFDGRGVGPPGAALANAATIDSVDGHDGHRLTKGHAGAAVLPAALAFLDSGATATATARELTTSLALGYEIATRAGIHLHACAADYHSSGAWNALGAAAIGARILRLGGDATAHALGIAEYHAPRSPMMRCIDHPTMVKDGSAWGALAGVSAALLAHDGFTGAPAALAASGTEDGTDVWADLGRRWLILDQYFKPFPVCRWAHPAVQATLDIVREYGTKPGQIDRVVVTTFHPATRLTSRTPRTTEEAQYSLPYAVAAAAVHREVTPHMVMQPHHADEHMHRLASSMRIRESAAMTRAFPATRQADVCLILTDGNRLRSGPTAATGDREEPLSDAALEAKFLTSVVPVTGKEHATGLLAALRDVENHDLREVLDALFLPAAPTATG
ncbi:MmgE/PrpD family protein [Streptomyces sp. URMC 127]|uniref:MmgE/PrpD family protein n=1 Tax=Streptomyces sp. URMC 127 TaxID=3423402 RepID=UPI003F1B730D